MLRSRRGIALLVCLLATADALAKWNVALNLGREPGSSMPESWAASGARFFLQTQVEFDDGTGDESEPFLGRGRAPRCVTAETAAFTGVGGRREVAVGSGAWVLARDRAPAVLRFWLDFSDATDVDSRGVALPAEKLYFTASAFDADDVADARRDLLPANQKRAAAQAEVDEVREGPNLFALAKKMDALAAAQSAVERVEERLPKVRDPNAGSLPGEARLYVDQGPISVKRPGLFGPLSREKYFIVGTFSLTPVLEGAELAASKRVYY
jgi:hypothetical protein